MSGTRDGRAARWRRRLVTIPLYFVLGAAVWLGLPLLLPLAALGDLVRGGRPWILVRCIAFFAWYLACEAVGIVSAGVLWVLERTLWRSRPERTREALYRLQARWAAGLFAGGSRLFGFRLEVEGLEQVGDGPLLVFMRHASVADTLLPAMVLGAQAGLRLRYVLKSELLWDPCLDLVGNRLPNAFVRRSSGDPEREVAGVLALVSGLGPRDGILIYPEGTRFTPAKRAQVLARIAAAGDPEALARAESLQRVLPPRLGGPLGLLEHPRRVDVLFLAHHGFDRAASFWEFWNGGLVGRTIRVALWRAPHRDVPDDRAKRVEWLHEQWRRVDAWVQEQDAREPRAGAPHRR